jgi:maltose/moltooligosaccharide transporter
MPYAILSGALPAARIGVYMGIFNFFIVIPEIVAALVFDGLLEHVFGGQQVRALVAGGVCMLVAAVLTQFVREPAHGADEQLQEIVEPGDPIPSATPPESPLR